MGVAGRAEEESDQNLAVVMRCRRLKGCGRQRLVFGHFISQKLGMVESTWAVESRKPASNPGFTSDLPGPHFLDLEKN